MDFESNSSTVEADDTEFNYPQWNSNSKDSKEKCELIFEVNTICNTNRNVSEYEYSEKSLQNASLSQISNQFNGPEQQTVEVFPNQPFNCFSNYSSSNESNSKTFPVNTDDSEHDLYNSDEPTLKNYKEKSLSLTDCNLRPLRETETGEQYSFQTEEDIHFPSQSENIDQSPLHIPPLRIENIDHSNCTECEDNLQNDLKRSRRNSKRKKDYDECCPICGVTVRNQDLESHYNHEIERLSKIPKNSRRTNSESLSQNDAFAEVKRNRESRLTARVAKFSARAKSEVKCPVCSLSMTGTAEEINKHVAFCFQDEDSDETINVEEEDESEGFEEYEFGDETRIRPISLVPGGYRSLHGNTSVIQSIEGEDVNVDVDDTATFGEPQYSELDVILDTSSGRDNTDTERLRQAVVTDSNVPRNVLEDRKWSKSELDSTENHEQISNNQSDLVVASLKEKLKDLEDESKNVKCLICLEPYTKPVVSTTCWHVHCEECWLMTMGVKKLCPQCNMIVFPSDLRKIYL